MAKIANFLKKKKINEFDNKEEKFLSKMHFLVAVTAVCSVFVISLYDDSLGMNKNAEKKGVRKMQAKSS